MAAEAERWKKTEKPIKVGLHSGFSVLDAGRRLYSANGRLLEEKYWFRFANILIANIVNKR